MEKTPYFIIYQGERDSSHFVERVQRPLASLRENGEFDIKIIKSQKPKIPGEGGAIIGTFSTPPFSDADHQTLNETCARGNLYIHHLIDDVFEHDQDDAIQNAHLVIALSQGWYVYAKTLNPNTHFIAPEIGIHPPKALMTRSDSIKKIILDTSHDPEWSEGGEFVRVSLFEHSHQIEVFAQNDQRFLQDFPKTITLHQYAPMNHANTIQLYDFSDILLWPVLEDENNATLSDQIILRSLAHGVIPITTDFAMEHSSIPPELVKIVRKPEDWSHHLNDLLDTPKTLQSMKEAGWEYVVHNRLWEGHIYEWETVLMQSLQKQNQLQAERLERLNAR